MGGGVDRGISEWIEAFTQAQDIDALRETFALALAQFGISSFTYGGLRLPRSASPDPLIMTSYSQEWVSHYLANNYREIDPVAHRGMNAFLPFSWSSVECIGDGRKVLEEGRESGLRSGLSVPVHGAANEFALVSLASDLDEAEFIRLMGECQHSLHILVMYFHARVSELAARRADPETVSLTRREREVMTWVAQGKTAWEISEILKISEATVVFHCENAKRKLGAYNRSYAVARALSLGLLNL